MLKAVLPFTTSVFGRFVAMPNTIAPIVSRQRAREYHAEIAAAMPAEHRAKACIPCYLTDKTTVAELIEGHKASEFFSAKFYPVGATTQSHAGVSDITRLYPLFEAMEKHGVPLMMHGEVVDADIDINDRERVFVERHLSDLVRHFPALIMTMEHLTTCEAVDFIAESQGKSRLAGTITLHHLTLTRNDMLDNGLRADYFCYPLVKTAQDRAALRKAATSGQTCYFLGTDSAPHPTQDKYATVAKAGIFSAPDCLAGYAAVFEAEGKLEQLEGFASLNGARHYGVAPNGDTVTLQRQPQPIPAREWINTQEQQKVRCFHHPSHWRVITG